ncbi:AraC family transcriptional regulator [Variovorax beijingensis]|uniref:AraC family transcriptional regulator n=1 Tax=Variovorax beijingensis TaxID=2496117 RepID=A0A561BE78_9BURK|nr:helix-turn-helix domain-containing protein [Variovorax beijingensis]TWD77205.1 AraC family transcriptional regulator [Variovorax beijingensis]
MHPSLVPVVEASTDFVPPSQRLEYWESHNANELIGLRCSAYSPQGLRARERNFDLATLRMAEISGNEHVVERAEPMLRRHPKDSVFACILLKGEAFFYQAGRCVPVQEGDLILYPTTLPYLYGFTREMRQVQVDISADRLFGGGRLRRLEAPVKFEAGLRSGRLLASTLRETMLDFMNQPLAEHAEGAASQVQTLMEALLTLGSPAARMNESAAVRLLRAEAFISEHLGEPELDAAAVARQMAMSVRNLDRLFEQHGCTVTQWIWRQRLLAARRQLEDPARAGVTIGEIALACGFSTQAHFASVFKAAYGLTPTQFRRDLAVPKAPGPAE